MSELTSVLYRSDEIAVTSRQNQDGTLEVHFEGAIEHPHPGVFLDPLLANLHAEMRASVSTALRVDFTRLAFLNSSGIKALIKWVMRVTDLAPQDRYAIQFVYNSEVTWQYASLKAITMLSRGAVSIVDRQTPRPDDSPRAQASTL